MIIPVNTGIASLPTDCQPWPFEDALLESAATEIDSEEVSLAAVRRYAQNKPCVWPKRRTYFFCDIHADTEALLLSLKASGGIISNGPGDTDYELSPLGRDALFVIGGDCFDKGPDNLRLLRALRGLCQKQASVSILAGNHDLRTYLGLAYAERREIRFQHLFVRMGKKAIPLFQEIHKELQRNHQGGGVVLGDDEVSQKLFPSKAWYRQFPAEVSALMSTQKIEKELKRIAEKSRELRSACADAGMCLGDMYLALKEAQNRFLDPDGEFAWYFESMTLAHQDGSFLFVHAGVDDTLAEVLQQEGVEGLNARFDALISNDLFELYNGPVGNAFRTKYRNIDFPLTQQGLDCLHAAGTYAIVHGHRNILKGQRLTLRAGILNFECDASVDRNTRKLEGLNGPGGAVVVFDPDGTINAISTDYPFIKQFTPGRVFGLTTIPWRKPPASEKVL